MQISFCLFDLFDETAFTTYESIHNRRIFTYLRSIQKPLEVDLRSVESGFGFVNSIFKTFLNSRCINIFLILYMYIQIWFGCNQTQLKCLWRELKKKICLNFRINVNSYECSVLKLWLCMFLLHQYIKREGMMLHSSPFTQ